MFSRLNPHCRLQNILRHPSCPPEAHLVLTHFMLESGCLFTRIFFVLSLIASGALRALREHNVHAGTSTVCGVIYCVHLFVYICIYVYVCMYVRTYVRTYVCMYVCTCVRRYVGTEVRRYVGM